jgi:hypothetical protein
MRKCEIGILLILAAASANAATRKVQYVDPNVVGGDGDGSSWANAYASLALWEAQDTNLITADNYLDVFCRSAGGDDGTGCTLAGWSTDATHDIHIQIDPNGWHPGECNDANYTLDCVTDHSALVIKTDYVTIDGLTVWAKTNGDSKFEGISIGDYDGTLTEVNNVTVKNCIVRDFTRNLRAGIRIHGTSGAGFRRVYNNLLIGNEHGIRISETRCFVANNTIVKSENCGINIWRNATLDLTAYNNVIDDSNVADWSAGSAGGSITTFHNYTSDTTSPDGATYRNRDPNYIDADANDYHLHADMAALIDDGQDCSSIFTTDVDGTVRTHWDAGFDEIVEGEEPPEPPVPETPMEYYVSPDGNDADANGLSEDTPWATLWKACNYVPDGATIYMMDGTYPFENWINPSSRRTYPTADSGLDARANWIYCTPDPNNTGEVIHEGFWIQNSSAAYYIDINDVNFTFPPCNNAPVPQRDEGQYLCHFGAGHYFKLRNCKFNGVLDGNGADPRFLNTYSLQKILWLGVAGSGAAMSHVIVDNCTIKDGWYGIYLCTDGCGSGIELTDNEISRTSAAGVMLLWGTYSLKPTGDDILIQGNTIRNQANVYSTGTNYVASGVTHGSGVYIDSENVCVNANVIDAYGSTAAFRTYPVAPGGYPTLRPSFADVTVTNNLVMHCLNCWFEMNNLVSGSRVSNNTVIGSHTEDNLYYFDTAATNTRIVWWSAYYEPMDVHDYNELYITNNIVLGPCDAGIRTMPGIVKGNMIWSWSDGMSQTDTNSVLPGNKVYCDTPTDDPNAEVFTVDDSFFAGVDWEYAFTRAEVVDGVWTAGNPTIPANVFDLAATSDAVGFADANGLPTTDYYGNGRDADPDSGYAEYYEAIPEPPPAVVYKKFLGRKS